VAILRPWQAERTEFDAQMNSGGFGSVHKNSYIRGLNTWAFDVNREIYRWMGKELKAPSPHEVMHHDYFPRFAPPESKTDTHLGKLVELTHQQNQVMRAQANGGAGLKDALDDK
jgi:hypothetical protein